MIDMTPELHTLALRINAAFDTTLERNIAVIAIAIDPDVIGQPDIDILRLLDHVETNLPHNDDEIATMAAAAIDVCDVASRTFGM